MSSDRSRTNPNAFAWNGLMRSGPWLALGVAVAFSIWMPLPPARTLEADARHARIKSAFAGVPLRMDDWVGEEAPLTPSAIELLRPNAAISRTYRRLGVPGSYNFSLIHCSDFRDMGGHYPPVCYPAHGWSLREEQGTERDVWDFGADREPSGARAEEAPRIEVSAAENLGPADLAVYRFSRTGRNLREVRMTVLSAFILPDGRWTRALSDIRDSAGRRRVAAEGVAQVQVAVSGWPALETIQEPVEAVLGSIPESVWKSLGVAEPTTEADSHE